MKAKFKETKSKKPCMACPFKRLNTNEKPNPGGSHPFVYLGQTRGPFWLPCHTDKNYEGKGSDTESVSQCRGAAIFRANCEDQYNLPEPLLKLEKDTEAVFANESEFVSHYLGGDIKQWERILVKPMLDNMMSREISIPSEHKRFFEQ